MLTCSYLYATNFGFSWHNPYNMTAIRDVHQISSCPIGPSLPTTACKCSDVIPTGRTDWCYLLRIGLKIIWSPLRVISTAELSASPHLLAIGLGILNAGLFPSFTALASIAHSFGQSKSVSICGHPCPFQSTASKPLRSIRLNSFRDGPPGFLSPISHF